MSEIRVEATFDLKVYGLILQLVFLLKGEYHYASGSIQKMATSGI